MAWKIHKKYVQRRQKARRNQRNRTLPWTGRRTYGDSRNLPTVRVKRYATYRDYSENDDGTLHFEGWYRQPYLGFATDYSFFNRLSREEFWAFQEEFDEAERRKYERSIHLSQYPHSRKGVKPAKRKYHRLRRRQSRELCYHALAGDEERFDSLPLEDYFRGAIKWDIW